MLSFRTNRLERGEGEKAKTEIVGEKVSSVHIVCVNI